MFPGQSQNLASRWKTSPAAPAVEQEEVAEEIRIIHLMMSSSMRLTTEQREGQRRNSIKKELLLPEGHSWHQLTAAGDFPYSFRRCIYFSNKFSVSCTEFVFLTLFFCEDFTESSAFKMCLYYIAWKLYYHGEILIVN